MPQLQEILIEVVTFSRRCVCVDVKLVTEKKVKIRSRAGERRWQLFICLPCFQAVTTEMCARVEVENFRHASRQNQTLSDKNYQSPTNATQELVPEFQREFPRLLGPPVILPMLTLPMVRPEIFLVLLGAGLHSVPQRLGFREARGVGGGAVLSARHVSW